MNKSSGQIPLIPGSGPADEGTDNESTTIEGSLESIVYANEENGWSVVKLVVPKRRGRVTVVGNLLGVQPGESLRLRGRWVEDRRYGEQFRVDSFLSIMPATLVGIEKYLGSGMIRGLGAVMAGRIVKHFGMDTLEAIDNEPERLREVEGVGPKRADWIRNAWQEQKEIKEVMIFLQSHGVSTAFAIRIYKTYGGRAIHVVKENPYQLALDIFGMGFRSADKIAEKLGIAKDSAHRAEAGVLHVLGEAGDGGHVYLPRVRLTGDAVALLEVEEEIVGTAVTALAGRGLVEIESDPGADERIYLASLYAAETGAADMLVRLLSTPSRSASIDADRAVEWVQGELGLEFAPRQAKALSRALTSKALVITGGPGTGKTTLVKGIIRILEKKKQRVVLCAPTGRAAKRMAELSGRDARTIHRLLEFNPRRMSFERNEGNPLRADIVIVDEVSMVDIVLINHLLKAIPPACRLVLVGDVDQLPSVGPGSVLGDVIASGLVDVVRLTEIFRQALESGIVVNAHKVNQGEIPLSGKEQTFEDFFFIRRDDPEEILKVLVELVTERIPRRYGLDPVGGIQVLTPMHKGLLGASNLNRTFQEILNPGTEIMTFGSRAYRAGDKVMQVRNNYDLDVFNGDLGQIDAIDRVNRRVFVKFDGRSVAYEYSDLDELVPAYACSIHKSQGSEYPAVVIPLHTQHYMLLQRNLLYTGITRGRRLVVLVGSHKALAIAVKNIRVEKRYTRLAKRLASAGR